MSRSCPVAGCEVLICGPRDLCSRHFNALPATQQKRLDDLARAAPGTPNAIRYRAELEASVTHLERRTRNTQKALAAEAVAPGVA